MNGRPLPAMDTAATPPLPAGDAVGATRRTGGRLLAVLLGLVGVSIFAGTLPATRIAVTELDPWFLSFARAAVATLPAAALLVLWRAPLPRRSDWRRWFAVVVGNVFGFPIFLGLAMEIAPAAHGAVVLAIMPLSTAVAATLVARERPSAAFWTLAGLGALVVLAFTVSAGGDHPNWGDVFLIGAAVVSSWGYAQAGFMSRSQPGWAVISWALVLALPVNVAAAALLFEPAYLAAPASVWTAFGYVAFFSMFIGFFFWNAALARGGIARIGQLQLLQPFITFAIAAALVGERVSPAMIAFAAATVVIVFLAQRARITESR